MIEITHTESQFLRLASWSGGEVSWFGRDSGLYGDGSIMAPQEHIPVAANVLGTIGTVLWCVQLIPQIWTNWRTKKTDGLPGAMMFLWALCKSLTTLPCAIQKLIRPPLGGVPFGTYAIVQNFNIPIQVQPQVFMALCLVSWVQILIYGQ